MISEAFAFRKLLREDLPLLHVWLNHDHMRDFYQKEPIDFAAVEAKFLPRVLGQTATHDHVALLNKAPIGKLQCYRNIDYTDYANEVGLTDGISIDLFIGEPNMLRRGLGRRMLRQYVDEIAFPLFPREKCCFICHDIKNFRAQACSMAAGFKVERPVIESGASSVLLSTRRQSQCEGELACALPR